MNGIVSYAQNFEDVMLWRALKHVEQGFYIDVGAQHPVIESVSLAFYEKGWRGIHVEPCPAYAALLREQRPDELVIEAAVSDCPGPISFFEIPGTGLSTPDPEIAERHRQAGYEVKEISVPCLPLSEVFQQAQDREIHWLKIDVEGWEKKVLQSWGRSEVRPWIVVIESTLPNTQEESFQAWEDLLLKRGYRFAYCDGLNRFYVHESHEELLSAFRSPPNVFDHFLVSQTAPYCANLNQQIFALTTQADQARQEIRVLREELENIKLQAERSESEWRTTFADKEAALEREQERVRWLESEWNAAKARIEELNGHAHHWYLVAQEREKQLAAMYASWSWKVTAPLRYGYKRIRRFSQQVGNTLAPYRKLLLRLLLFVMRVVLRHPRLAERIKRQILGSSCGYLRIHRPLRALAIRHRLIATPTVSNSATSSAAEVTEPDAADLARLSPHARRIYEDLKAAIAKRRQEVA